MDEILKHFEKEAQENVTINQNKQRKDDAGSVTVTVTHDKGICTNIL